MKAIAAGVRTVAPAGRIPAPVRRASRGAASVPSPGFTRKRPGTLVGDALERDPAVRTEPVRRVGAGYRRAHRRPAARLSDEVDPADASLEGQVLNLHQARPLDAGHER